MQEEGMGVEEEFVQSDLLCFDLFVLSRIYCALKTFKKSVSSRYPPQAIAFYTPMV